MLRQLRSYSATAGWMDFFVFVLLYNEESYVTPVENASYSWFDIIIFFLSLSFHAKFAFAVLASVNIFCHMV